MSSTMWRNSVVAAMGVMAMANIALADAQRITLWPKGEAPGLIREEDKSAEKDAERNGGTVTEKVAEKGVAKIGDKSADKIPDKRYDKDSDPFEPTMDIYLPPPDKAIGSAVIVLPGGGYGGLATSHEGKQVAEFFNSQGIAAFVVRYRHAPRYHHPIPLGDAQRAIRIVRSRAAEFKISPSRIGVMGFSAGGHLTSTTVTHFDAGKADATDPIERMSSRPDFGVLCYPVITLMDEPFVHKGSRSNLLGPSPAEGLQKNLSNELQVTKETPPCFLFHTDDDKGVPAENSVLFYLALRKAGVPAEMHIFKPGNHGLGLAPTNPSLSIWPTLLVNWMKLNGWLEPLKPG